MQKTAAFSTRCSTEEQSKGFSHEYQVENMMAHPMVKEMKIIGHFKDSSTGRRFDNREGLNRAFDLYSELRGTLDYLLVYRWDRFGRDVGEAFALIKKFEGIGVNVNCPDKWIDYKDPNWPLILAIEFGMAQSESLKNGDRTKDGTYARNVNGYYTGRVPVGYKRIVLDETHANGKRVKLMVPTEKADIIRTIFEKYAGRLATKGELYEDYGEKLEIKRAAFYELFHNQLYVGLIPLKAYKHHPARIVAGKHEAIVSQKIFDAAQKVKATHARSFYRKRKEQGGEFQTHFYLKGVIRCFKTGRYMTAAERKKPSGRLYFFYEAKYGQIVNAIDAHRLIYSVLKEIELTEELHKATKSILLKLLKEKQRQDSRKIKELNKVVEKNKARLSNIEDKYLDNELDLNRYTDLNTKYRLKVAADEQTIRDLIESKDSEVSLRIGLLDVMKNLSKLFHLVDYKGKTSLLKCLFPEGFSIEKQVIRTRRLNTYLVQMIGESRTYECLEIKKGFLLQGIQLGVSNRSNSLLKQLAQNQIVISIHRPRFVYQKISSFFYNIQI